MRNAPGQGAAPEAQRQEQGKTAGWLRPSTSGYGGRVRLFPTPSPHAAQPKNAPVGGACRPKIMRPIRAEIVCAACSCDGAKVGDRAEVSAFAAAAGRGLAAMSRIAADGEEIDQVRRGSLRSYQGWIDSDTYSVIGEGHAVAEAKTFRDRALCRAGVGPAGRCRRPDRSFSRASRPIRRLSAR